MTDITWDPATYLRHGGLRERPFTELLARVPVEARSVVDLGCGPGNLTPLIRSRWPDADIVCVDSSPEMLDRARATDPEGTYVLADVHEWSPDGPVDAIVSNALFQWVPDRFAVVERLLGHLRPGGAFAMQVPANHDAALHRLLREAASREPYAAHQPDERSRDGLDAVSWLSFLSDLGCTVDAWSTTYLHLLPGDDAVWGWVSGTAARPYVQAMPDELRGPFVEDYKRSLRAAYPRQPWGTVLPFERTFVVATRPAASI